MRISSALENRDLEWLEGCIAYSSILLSPAWPRSGRRCKFRDSALIQFRKAVPCAPGALALEVPGLLT